MSTTTTYTGVRIVDMPDLGAINDASSLVGERAGSGRFAATALPGYIAASPGSPLGTLPSIAALRANTLVKSAANPFYVTGYAVVSDGGEGLFVRAVSDTTSLDNGGTIIVDAVNQRWYRQNNGDTSLSVRWFGAKGDGTTNDAPAFITTIGVANAAGGGRIYIPKGSYRLNSMVTATAGNIHFEGDGAESFIINGMTNAPAIQLGDGTTISYNYRVSGLQFATAAGVVAGVGNIGLRATKVGQCRFDNLVFTRYPSANYDNLSLETVTQSTVTSIFSQSCLRHGIYFLTSGDLYISNVRSDTNVNGYVFDDCQGFYCVNMCGFGNTGNAFWMQTGATGNFNMFFANCIGDSSGASNWNIQALSLSTLANCWASTQASQAVNTWASGFDISGPNCKELTFVGGMAVYNNQSGMHLSNSGGTPHNITITGMILGSATHGNGQGGTGYGLAIDSGCQHIKVIGGSAAGNVSGQISNSATTDIEITGVAGYVTRSSGLATLAAGSTAVNVNHNLSGTPIANDITITPASSLGSAKTLYFDPNTINSTAFTVHSDVAPGSLTYFNWSARLVQN